MLKGAWVRTLIVGACAASLSGCGLLMGGGMMGMGGGQPQQAQANDSGVGSTAGQVAGGQMAKSIPFGSQIGGLVGQKTEQTVRSQNQQQPPQQPAQPAGSTQAP
jgi:hypothetical protein